MKKMIKDGYEEFKMPDTGDKGFFGSQFGNAGIYVRKTSTISQL